MNTSPAWWQQASAPVNTSFSERARERQAQLTKPAGALGELETLAIRLAGLQGRDRPQLDTIHISIFAGDHGVTAEGISAFPAEVTGQMVLNFLNGGAAISVLARQLNAQLEVVDVGILQALPAQAGLIIQRAGAGTANSAQQAAMTEAQLRQALQAGFEAAERACAAGADLFIGGEMGIGNTTAATALYCALLALSPTQLTGAGTGLNVQGIAHKANVIQTLLTLHQSQAQTPLDWLRCVGGFEIAALTGAYLRAAQHGLPILVDGFISTAAALVALRCQPALVDWLFLSHASAEQGHRLVLNRLGLKPLLDLGLRLGEGSGAALAVPLLRHACALHNQMATFAEAAVAGKSA